MESAIVELLKPITLNKENCSPLVFETGTVLKVIMKTPEGLLARNLIFASLCDLFLNHIYSKKFNHTIIE